MIGWKFPWSKKKLDDVSYKHPWREVQIHGGPAGLDGNIIQVEEWAMVHHHGQLTLHEGGRQYHYFVVGGDAYEMPKNRHREF